MNPATSQPEGSPRNEVHADLIAANFPGNPAVNHWACGMPLSYVQEMADQWLSRHDQLVRPNPAFELTADNEDDAGLREGSLETKSSPAA